jgi:transcription initiation factor TFIID subunit 6
LAALAGNDNVAFKPLVKHVVSKELILFFDKIRGAILDEDPDPEVVILRESALESVRSDPGLHQLVPYFVQFVAEKVTHSTNNTFVLRQMMDLTSAVITNKSLFVDPYVSNIVAPILTCLVGRNIGAGTPESLKSEFQLRDMAASLLGQICTKYAESSEQLRPRLVRTLLKYFLDPQRSLGEHYGAIAGLITVGGPEGIRSLLLPNIKPFEYVLTKAQNERGANDQSISMVIAILVKAVSSITDSPAPFSNGTNGVVAAEAPLVEEFLGTIIGSRVNALSNRALCKAVLEAREKNLKP